MVCAPLLRLVSIRPTKTLQSKLCGDVSFGFRMVLKVIPTLRILSHFVADEICTGAVAGSLSAFKLPSQDIMHGLLSQGTFTDKWAVFRR